MRSSAHPSSSSSSSSCPSAAGPADTPISLPSPSPTERNLPRPASASAAIGDSPEFLEYRDVPQGVIAARRSASPAARRGFDYDLSGRDAGQDDQRIGPALGRGGAGPPRRTSTTSPIAWATAARCSARGRPACSPLPRTLRRASQAAIDRARPRRRPSTTRSSPRSRTTSFAAGATWRLAVARRDSGLDVALQPGDGLDRSTRATAIGGARATARPASASACRTRSRSRSPSTTTTHDRRSRRRAGAEMGGPERERAVRRVSQRHRSAPRGQPLPGDRRHRARRAARARTTRPPPARARPRSASRPTTTRSPPTRAAAVRLPLRTRVTADVTVRALAAVGRSPARVHHQHRRSVDAADPAAVPIDALDGAIDIDSQTVQVTSAPWSRLSAARRASAGTRWTTARRASPCPESRAWTRSWEGVPADHRPLLPRAHARGGARSATASAPGGLEAGHRQEDITRTFRETEETSETTWTGALSGRAARGRPPAPSLRARPPRLRGLRFAPLAGRVAGQRASGAQPRRGTALRPGGARPGSRGRAPRAGAPSGARARRRRTRWSCGRYPLTAVRAREHAGPRGLRRRVRGSGRTLERARVLLPGARVELPARAAQPAAGHLHRPARHLGRRRCPTPFTPWARGFAADLDPGRTTLRLEGVVPAVGRARGFRAARPAAPPTSRRTSPPLTTCAGSPCPRRSSTASARGGRSRLGPSWEAQAVSDSIDEGRPDYVPGAFVLAPRSLDYGAIVAHARVTRRW